MEPYALSAGPVVIVIGAGYVNMSSNGFSTYYATDLGGYFLP